jgi:hypothetical protein
MRPNTDSGNQAHSKSPKPIRQAQVTPLPCTPEWQVIAGMLAPVVYPACHSRALTPVSPSPATPGSVLTFRANGRMRLGHVAVVDRVINPREIEIEHANWWGPGAHGGVSRNIPVVDVSEANDWSAVRVGLGQSGEFGSVYPTYGFIYDRPDTGVMVASTSAPAPQAELNPAPNDLRPRSERGWQTYEEVAEAPATTPVRHRRSVHLASYHPHRLLLSYTAR